MTNSDLNKFYQKFMGQVFVEKDKGNDAFSPEDCFTSVMMDYLEDIGEIDSPVNCPFHTDNLQLNAYCVSDDYENVDIIVSLFKEKEKPEIISDDNVDSIIKRAVQLYRKSINDLHKDFQKDNDTYEFAITMHQKKNDIKDVRIIVMTNGITDRLLIKSIKSGNAEIFFDIWDINRLYKIVASGKTRETFEIDFKHKFGKTLDCLENNTSDKYSGYLAIISGEILASLYREHGPRLLEKNVRSFLQVKGAVNKGIKETLKQEPEMFLAYNNGISVTAESVEIIRDENGKPSIKKITDMQIVNGGQTTASIFHSMSDSDLSEVFVQMKLSVINSHDDTDEIVKKISKFANTQNKIDMADFSANDPFHQTIEQLSKDIDTPVIKGTEIVKWIYERHRGDYADLVNSKIGTNAKRDVKKDFTKNNPCFTKTDLAKYENLWDQYPYEVCKGAQKNFASFTLRLNQRMFTPNEEYYKDLIAKALLFKRAEEIMIEQKYSGYKAQIVAYTLAFLSYKTAQRIDLDMIWSQKGISKALNDEIIKSSEIIRNIIINSPNGANISEWCKNTSCWEKIRVLDYNISPELNDELISVERVEGKSKRVNTGINVVTQSEQQLIDEANAIPASTWFALSRWSSETNNFEGWQRRIIYSVGQRVGRNQQPTINQLKYAMPAYQEAIDKGFKSE